MRCLSAQFSHHSRRTEEGGTGGYHVDAGKNHDAKAVASMRAGHPCLRVRTCVVLRIIIMRHVTCWVNFGHILRFLACVGGTESLYKHKIDKTHHGDSGLYCGLSAMTFELAFERFPRSRPRGKPPFHLMWPEEEELNRHGN